MKRTIRRLFYILGLSCGSLASACTWWGEPYYIVDEKYFALKDYVHQLVIEQNHLSSKEYFNKRFGTNNWNLKPNISEIVAPDLFDISQDTRITIKVKDNKNTHSNIYIIAELSFNNKYAYIDLTKLTKQPVIQEITTNYRLPDTANIFMAETRTDNKTIIIGPKNIKQNTGCGYIKVRTQKEATTLNKKVCNQFSGRQKNKTQACIELKK